jgi:Matrixin
VRGVHLAALLALTGLWLVTGPASMPTGSVSPLTGSAWAHDETFLGFRLLDLENQTVKWQSPHMGVGASLTYAFATETVDTPGARNCAKLVPPENAYFPSHITADQFRHEVAEAFRIWEGVANLTFREARDPREANILIGAQGEPQGRAFTNVTLTKAGAPGQKTIEHSLICLNPRQPWKVGFDGRLDVYDLRYTIAHEIGHAIGLDHPGAAGELMSYRYDEHQKGLQPGDTQGVVLLYGRRPGTTPYADIETGSIPAHSAPQGSKAAPSFAMGEPREKSAPAR